jgi:hypothetical protein
MHTKVHVCVGSPTGMGTHWFLDVTRNGSMTWQAANLFPIVTMYNEETATATGTINAFFFASSVVQQSLLPPSTNEWEPIPLPNILMCVPSGVWRGCVPGWLGPRVLWVAVC